MNEFRHGTCVALGRAGALLRGEPGSGKSDLALRFLFLPRVPLFEGASLVADDRVELKRRNGRVVACCPAALAGRLEVRGVGIVAVEAYLASAELRLLVDLTGDDAQRMPHRFEREELLGLAIQRISLDPFAASAPLKLALAIRKSIQETVD
jgi:serine kinase of HPr protein (carbohydrate metabolism regulator)